MLKDRLWISLWPAFLMAGVLEALVFAVLDPSELRWFGGALVAWPPTAVYSVSFLIFWGVISVATGLTALLMTGPDQVNARQPRDAARGRQTPGGG